MMNHHHVTSTAATLGFLALAVLSAAGPASAESDGPTVVGGEFSVPEHPPIDRYAKLWEKSPFEFEIIVEEEVVEEENPFEDLALAGFSSDGSVSFVTLFNTKDPNADRIRLRSDRPNEDGFKILRVERGSSYKDTVVHLQKGNDVGTATYDEKRLAMKPSGAVGGPAPGARGGNVVRPGQPNNPAAALAAARAAAARGGNPGAPGQAPAPGGNAPAAAAAAGQQPQAGASQNRNEVIQRLLERARQRQAEAQQRGGGERGGDGGNRAQPQRRRVVLPPSSR